MPFLLGHPQLLFFDAEQDVAAITSINNTKIAFLFKSFISTVM